MNIIFDNIIFSLQNAGGISVLWYEILKRILNDPDFETNFIDQPNQNIFRSKINIPAELILKDPFSKLPLTLQRYLNPININAKGIFHSSYYRTLNHPRVLNITTVHDFTYEFFRKGIAKKIHSTQKFQAIKKANRIICVSENTKKDLLKFNPKINEKKIQVIYNGVDEAYQVLHDKNNSSLKSIIPFDKDGYVLYVGDRISKYKNFAIAAEASGKAKIPLVIAGGGEITANESLMLNKKLGPHNFIQISQISNSELNILYNYAHCLFYPSAYEGFGIPVIEAQSAGCPVICSNFSSIPEVAGSGAILLSDINVDSAVEMLKLLQTDTKLKSQIIEEGLINAKRFSWDKCYQQTKQVYKEVYEELF